MGWEPTLYSLVAFGSAGVSILVTALAWRHRSEPAAPAFLALVVGLDVWAVVYGVQLGETAVGTKLVWMIATVAVGVTIPTLWLVFAIQYTGMGDLLTRRRAALLAIEPVGVALLAVTNPHHELLWREATLVTHGSLHTLALSFTPLYFAHFGYAYLAISAGLGLLLLSFLRSDLYRTQTGLLILGMIPPFLANAVSTVVLDSGALAALDLTPFAFTITGVSFGMALFHSDLLDRESVARKRVLSDTDDGVVVLDDAGEVVTANSTARGILGPAPVVGRSVREMLPDAHDTEISDDGDGTGGVDAIDGATVTATVDGQRRTYDVSCSPLSDPYERVVGHVVEFRDVTHRHAYEQRLEVSYRVLRHNLRNDMNVVHGRAQQLAENASGKDAEAARHIVETAERLVDLSEKARTMMETADRATAESTAVNVRDCVAPLVKQFRREHPDAAVELDVPPETAVTVPNPDLLEIVVRNLVENALEHNDARNPAVRVTADSPADSEFVRIRVADDGPGIPEAERAVLKEGSETPLRHGSGLGLWLVYWSVTAAGGEVSFAENDPRGSVVTFTLRSASGDS